MKFLILLFLLVAVVGVLLYLALYHAGFKRMMGKYFYNWLYGLKWGVADTNNYGYAPAGPEAIKHGNGEQYQLQLYHEAAKVITAIEWPELRVLEVGCGRGGGLRFLAKILKPKEVAGLDFSQNAIQFCRKRSQEMGLKVNWVRGDAMHLPFGDGTFDIVLNVESSHIYADQAQFLREAARLLAPGGHLIIADYRLLGAEGIGLLDRDLAGAGLKVANRRVISERVLEACSLDAQRRKDLIGKGAPGFLKNYLYEFAMVPESSEYRNFLHTYEYFIIECVKA